MKIPDSLLEIPRSQSINYFPTPKFQSIISVIK